MTDAAPPTQSSRRGNRRGSHFAPRRRRAPLVALGSVVVALAGVGAGYAYVGTGGGASGPGRAATLASSDPATAVTPGASTPSSAAASSTTAPSTTAPSTTACAATKVVSPASVYVQVANGSGVTGQAAATATALGRLGYRTSVNLTANNYTYASSVIEYAPDSAAAARQLQATLRSGGQLLSDGALTPTPFNVEIITGKDFSGVAAPKTSAAPAC